MYEYIARLIFASVTLVASVPAAAETVLLASPNGRSSLSIDDSSKKGPTYQVKWRDQSVLAPSILGLQFEKNDQLGPGMHIVGTRRAEGADHYHLLAGSRSEVNDRYRAVEVDLAESGADGRKLTIIMRAYNDGIAFRYRMPQNSGLTSLRIANEATEFAFPAAYDCTGFNVGHTGSSHEGEFDPVSAQEIRPHNMFDLPLLCQTGHASFAITEADLHDYAGMYLSGRGAGDLGVSVSLSPHLDDKWVAVTRGLSTGPVETPWRVVLLGDTPGDLVPSTIVTSLNPPPSGDFSWVKPGKYAWDWWSGPSLASVPKAGTNNATIRGFIDFAHDAKLPYMVVDEGWYVNSGYGGYLLPGADATKIIPGFDLQGLVRYGAHQGVRIVVWAHWALIDRDMEGVLSNLERIGVAGIKVDFMDRDDQAMVAFYDRLLAATAKHHLLLDLHGAFVPRGTARTWPHFITQEGVFGAEQNKGSRRVTARHNINLAFTRAILGPTDYTPGGFRNVRPEDFEPRNALPEVPTTRGQALALYVAYFSPFQAVSDTPDAYRRPGGGWVDGFDFIQEVPTTWDETRVLSGTPGESIVIARRKGRTWYVGAMTDAARTVAVPLTFLGKERAPAQIWEDGAAPTELIMSKRTVGASDTLTLHLAQAGGAVVRIGKAPQGS